MYKINRQCFGQLTRYTCYLIKLPRLFLNITKFNLKPKKRAYWWFCFIVSLLGSQDEIRGKLVQ